MTSVLVASAAARGLSEDVVRAEAMALMSLGTPMAGRAIAAMVALLCSDDGRHILGEDIAMASGIPAN